MNSRTPSRRRDVDHAPGRIGRLAGSSWLVAVLACAVAASCIAASSHAATRHKAAARQVAASSPQGQEPGPWSNQRFVYKAEGKRLSVVLQDFAASQGMPAIVGDGVDGVVHGSFDSTPLDFLNAINKTFGVIWYQEKYVA